MEEVSKLTERKKCTATIVFNDKGEIALQLRAAHDDSFPSHWDFAAGGGIDEGEDPAESVAREIREELGVETTPEFVVRKHYIYPAWKSGVTREIDLWIYRAHHNGPFSPDPGEVEKVEFFSYEQIEKMMQSGEKIHPELRFAWNDAVIHNALE